MISIIIPVYNEAPILKDSLERLEAWLNTFYREAFEVLVVENGSTDATWSLACDLAKEKNWLVPIQISQRSVGRAFAEGVKRAQFEKIISLDCDLSTDLNFINIAKDLLQYSSMVVGSKTLGQQKRSLLRIFGSQLYLVITQILFQMTLTDFSMGAKAYRKSILLPIVDFIDDWTAYVFEICVWLTLQKEPILQIGVSCVDERDSHFNLWHEGFYRYSNLVKVRRKIKDPKSWYRRVPSDSRAEAL